MGWFSRKKKVPNIEFPQGETSDDQALQFPSSLSIEKTIEPNQLKVAAGVQHNPVPQKKEKRRKELQNQAPLPQMAPAMPKMPPLPSQNSVFDQGYSQSGTFVPTEGPLYMKKSKYEEVLESLDDVVGELVALQGVNKALLQIEHNDFGNLRRHIKSIHDRLLSADAVLFKAGE